MARKHQQRPFRFGPEAGARLRTLRERAGLGVEALARQMGRTVGYASYLSRLERGDVKYPTVSVVLDYLRACRSSIGALADLFDRYTAQPLVAEVAGREKAKALVAALPPKVARQVDSYDIKTAAARRAEGKPPLDPMERELRVRRQAQAAIERDLVDRAVHKVMDELGVVPMMDVRRTAFDFAHKLWRILRTTRPLPGRPLDWRGKSREARLDEVSAKTAESGIIPAEGLALLRGVVEGLFEQMEQSGRLDRLPTLQQARLVPKPLSHHYKGGAVEAPTKPTARGRPYNAVWLEAVTGATTRRLTEMGFKGDALRRCITWIPLVRPIALATEPGSPEREQRIAAASAQTRDPELFRKVAAEYFDEFERWRGRLFG
jgi:transcriptional regulator with XRE-family HTH domain